MLNKTVKINWKLTNKEKGLTGVDVFDTLCVVREIKKDCFGNEFAYFWDKIYTPVRIERLSLVN